MWRFGGRELEVVRWFVALGIVCGSARGRGALCWCRKVEVFSSVLLGLAAVFCVVGGEERIC